MEMKERLKIEMIDKEVILLDSGEMIVMDDSKVIHFESPVDCIQYLIEIFNDKYNVKIKKLEDKIEQQHRLLNFINELLKIRSGLKKC